MNENPGIEITTHREIEDISIKELKKWSIIFLQEFLADVFEIYQDRHSETDWEELKDEEWKDIGMEIFGEDTWTKTDGKKVVGTQYLKDQNRTWDAQTAIDIILIAVEGQTEEPILSCKYINRIVEPLWEEIGEAVFSIWEYEAIEEAPWIDSD